MIRIAVYLLLAGLSATPALACDCMRLIAGAPNLDRGLDAIIADSAVIAEGVLITPTRFRATHVLRGARQAHYDIGSEDLVISGCTLYGVELERRVGQRTLMILRGRPGAYEASRCSNFQDAAVEDAIRRRLRVAPSAVRASSSRGSVAGCRRFRR
jgi:hypothetical protein